MRVHLGRILVGIVSFCTFMFVLTVLQSRTTHLETQLHLELKQQGETIDYRRFEDAFSIRDSIVVVKLLQAHKDLSAAQKHVRGAKAAKFIQKSLSSLGAVIHDIGGEVPSSHRSMGKSQYVCPEEHMGTLYGYPFYETGFELTNCSHGTPIEDSLSILVICMNQTDAVAKDIIKNIVQFNDKITIVLAVNKEMETLRLHETVLMVIFNETATHGHIWNKLIEHVSTPFLFVARNLEWFSGDDARLLRLVRELDEVKVAISAGSIRTLTDGHWKLGCQQMSVKNYTLSYLEGYDESIRECLFCDNVEGPFVARTEFISEFKFDDKLPSSVLFEDLFLRMLKDSKELIVCPDSMFYVESFTEKSRQDWIPLIEKWRLTSIQPKPNVIYRYTDIYKNKKFTKSKGIALAHTLLEDLSYAIKFYMETCEKHNIICELQEGTLLGAVKLNKVLPWERDADLTFLSSNFTALSDLAPVFHKAGFGFTPAKDSLWCCADNITAGGKIIASYRGWNIEIYGQHKTDSSELRARNMQPTKLHFDGMWINVPRNPGLVARNRYGHDIYRHAQHWLSLRKKNGWIQYKPEKFTTCPDPGSHACLDQYHVDGNIQFQMTGP